MVRGLATFSLHQGNGLITSIAPWEEAGRHHCPFVFLEGDHSYASVRRDIDGILVVVPEPILLLQDTFLKSSESGYNIGTCRANEESLDASPDRFRAVRLMLSLPGMTLLYSTAAAMAQISSCDLDQ